MATYGINFRDTLVYRTDVSPDSYCPYNGSVPNYPQVLTNGATVGWLSATGGMDARNRSTSNDAELAGSQFANDSSKVIIFAFNLSGTNTTWDIQMAIGDQAFGCGAAYMEILDGASSLFTVINTSAAIAADQYCDATGVIRTTSNDWVTNNASKRLTFSGSIASFKIQTGIGSPLKTTLAHLSLSQVLGTNVTVSAVVVSSSYSLPSDQINCGSTILAGVVSATYSLPSALINSTPVTVSASTISSSYSLPFSVAATTIFNQVMTSIKLRL